MISLDNFCSTVKSRFWSFPSVFQFHVREFSYGLLTKFPSSPPSLGVIFSSVNSSSEVFLEIFVAPFENPVIA